MCCIIRTELRIRINSAAIILENKWYSIVNHNNTEFYKHGCQKLLATNKISNIFYVISLLKTTAKAAFNFKTLYQACISHFQLVCSSILAAVRRRQTATIL